MKLLGLIGNPISHSRSPEIFQEFFKTEGFTQWDYWLFPLPHISELPDLFHLHENLCGLNVTIPFKKAVIPYLDFMDKTALKTGAVNTVKVERQQNKLYLSGYNTDVYGFNRSLEEWLTNRTVHALVLGTGGSSQSVCTALEMMGIPFQRVSRTPSKLILGYQDLDETIISQHKLIINTTPLGMTQWEHLKPELPYGAISSAHFCYDLVYAPSETAFLKICATNGAKTLNGWNMLNYQAQKAWEIFKNSSSQIGD